MDRAANAAAGVGPLFPDHVHLALHQLGVEQALMLPGQRAQFSGQGEGDQEIAARHPPLRLPLDPLRALKVLAMRTIAMTAGVRHQALFIS